jgi:hypothetical protein
MEVKERPLWYKGVEKRNQKAFVEEMALRRMGIPSSETERSLPKGGRTRVNDHSSFAQITSAPPMKTTRPEEQCFGMRTSI